MAGNNLSHLSSNHSPLVASFWKMNMFIINKLIIYLLLHTLYWYQDVILLHNKLIKIMFNLRKGKYFLTYEIFLSV